MSLVGRPPPQWGVRGVITQPLVPIPCCLSLARDNLSAPPSALFVMTLEAWAARSTGILRGSGDTGPEYQTYSFTRGLCRAWGRLWTQVLASRQPVEEAT